MISIFSFLAAIVAANLSIAYFGPIASPINAFVFIGLDITLRDKLHERWHGKLLGVKMVGLITSGAVITYILNRGSGQICIASIIAFSVALMVDAILYEILIKKGRITKINGSNIGAAAADSILFPTIAFGVWMPLIILLQFSAKVFGGFIWSIIFNKTNNK